MASHHLPSPAATPSALPPSQTQSGLNGNGNGLLTNADERGMDSSEVEIDQMVLRAEVEQQILKLSQDLYELEICAGDVGTGMEDAVPNYLSKINAAFVQLSQLAGQMTDSVPHQIIDNVDRSKNPHLYTKQVVTRATGENQYALGRVLGLESFRRQLSTALADTFPEIPLPERRHQPNITKIENDAKAGTEAGVNGNGDVAKDENEKMEVKSELRDGDGANQ